MKLVLMTTTSSHERWAEEARKLYLEKISHFMAIEIQEIKPNRNSRSQGHLKASEESEKFLMALKPDDYVIVFDERGDQLTSPAFSKKIERVLMSGKKRCIFVVGGAFGLSEAVRRRADVNISLSPMVFNHLVAQTVALEQIYRAFTIIKNLPYHNI